jgi:hypothetical protein
MFFLYSAVGKRKCIIVIQPRPFSGIQTFLGDVLTPTEKVRKLAFARKPYVNVQESKYADIFFQSGRRKK